MPLLLIVVVCNGSMLVLNLSYRSHSQRYTTTTRSLCNVSAQIKDFLLVGSGLMYTASNSICEPLLLTLPQNHSTAVTTFNNGRIIFSAMGTLFMLALLLISPAKAGFGAKCIQSWTKSEKKIDGTYSDLSKCQQSTIGLKTVNDILLGGKGGAEIIGIPSGGGGEGCSGGDSCMKQCQALCCITKGCIYSSVKKGC